VDVQPDNLEGVFTLDVSELDGPDTLGWRAEDAGQWVNVVCDVSRLSMRRGATRLQGVLTRAEAGAVTVVLTDYSGTLDPLLNGDAVHKGTPLRLRAWGDQWGYQWLLSRTNLALNPRLAGGPSGWSTSTGAGGAVTTSLPVSGGPDGGTFARLTFTTAPTAAFYGWRLDGRVSTGMPLPVTAGQMYTASLYVRNSAAQTMQARLYWYTAAGASVSNTNSSSTAVPANTWTRLSVSGVAPATATHLMVAGYTTAAPLATVGMTMDATMALVEQSPDLEPYFDGDTPDVGSGTAENAEDVLHLWVSAAHASQSQQLVAESVLVPWDATLFTGEVDELFAEYLPGLPATVTVTGSDLIAPLAAWEAEGLAGDGVGAGDDLLTRVERVLDEVDRGTVSPDSDAAFAATLNPTKLERGWETITAAADAELGRVWVDTENRLVVRGRNSQLTGPIRGTLSDVHGEAVEDPHTCMSAAAVVHGVELLANRAVASRRLLEAEDPDTALVLRREDTYSQARYGVGSVDRRGQLELETDGQLGPWAEAMVVAGTRPELRVDSVTPSPTEDDLTEAMAQWPAVMSTRIGDRWRFRFHPLAGHVVDRTLGVLGVELELTPEAWSVTWTTTEAASGAWFTLDVSELDGPDVLPPYSVPMPVA
jgi:hypothetical protein